MTKQPKGRALVLALGLAVLSVPALADNPGPAPSASPTSAHKKKLQQAPGQSAPAKDSDSGKNVPRTGGAGPSGGGGKSGSGQYSTDSASGGSSTTSSAGSGTVTGPGD